MTVNSSTGLNPGYAYVDLSTAEEVGRAIKVMDGVTLRWRHLRVKRYWKTAKFRQLRNETSHNPYRTAN
jgi:hypothetical protein